MDDEWAAVDVADEAAVLRYCAKEVMAVERACKNANAGFVTWDSTPPTGVSYQTHKFSFMDAVQTCLVFCGTDLTHEWLLIGRGLLPVVRTLPQLVEDLPAGGFTADISFLGHLGGAKVWYSWLSPAWEFYAGCGSVAARGLVLNPHITFAAERRRSLAQEMDEEIRPR